MDFALEVCESWILGSMGIKTGFRSEKLYLEMMALM